jgi:hypothetical protein
MGSSIDDLQKWAMPVVQSLADKYVETKAVKKPSFTSYLFGSYFAQAEAPLQQRKS